MTLVMIDKVGKGVVRIRQVHRRSRPEEAARSSLDSTQASCVDTAQLLLLSVKLICAWQFETQHLSYTANLRIHVPLNIPVPTVLTVPEARFVPVTAYGASGIRRPIMKHNSGYRIDKTRLLALTSLSIQPAT